MKKSDSGKKQQIMTEAEALFSLNGFQNTTITQIARACSIAEASIYEYFKNKEDLLFSIPEKHCQDLTRSLKEHLLGIHGAENKIRKLIWHYLLFMEERPEFARLFVLEIWSNKRYYQSEKRFAVAEYWDLVKSIIVEAKEDGFLNINVDPLVSQCMIYGTINNYILTNIVFEKELKLVDKGMILEQIFFDAMKGTRVERDSIWEVNGKKALILQAALSEFDLNGYLQTTIAQICGKAGITEPTLYEYYKGKEDILMAIPELAVDKFIKDLRESLIRNDHPESKLKLFLWNQLVSYETYPDYYRVLLSELTCNPNFYQSPTYTAMRQYPEELIAIIKLGIDAGVFKKDINFTVLRHLYLGIFDQLLIYSMARPNNIKLSKKLINLYDIIMNIIQVPFSFA